MLFSPFDNYNKVDGAHTFMRNLREYFDSIDYEYQLEADENTSVIFFPISYDLKQLEILKAKNVKIIQRLDGIYYPSKHGSEYIDKNKDTKVIYQDLADYVVFQSEYSKQQCFAMFGELDSDKYEIIINGAHNEKFFPSPGKKEVSEKFKLITTGNFRNLDMLEPVVKALDMLVKRNTQDFELNVVGPVVNPLLTPLLDRPYIKYVDYVSNSKVAELLRENDVFVYSHLNPPCPNSVIEAISTGMPVVGFDPGSMKELLYFSTDLLAEVNNEIFQKYEDFKHEKLADKLMLSMEKYQFYKDIAIKHSTDYDFKKAGERYIKLFEKVIE